jgi:stage II sporulation protein AA (anti-sigma F factor antagonist)
VIITAPGNDTQQALTRLRLDVRGPVGGMVEILATGEIDMDSAPRLGAVVTDLLGRERLSGIEVNLAAVPFMDSCGINTLIGCLTLAHASQRQLRVSHPQPSVRRVLDITGVSGLLGVPTH